MGNTKRLLVAFSIFLLFGTILTPKIYSQENAEEQPTTISSEAGTESQVLDFDKAFQEYNQKVEEYDLARADYILKRAQYLRFGTLVSQTEAFSSTLTFLQKRDEIVIYYLKALKAKLSEGIGVTDARRKGLYFRLDQEMIWFEEHKEKLPSAGTLSDLVNDSGSAKRRYDSAAPLYYETLAVISDGRVTDFQERIQDLFPNIKEKVDDIKKDEREEYKLTERKTQILDRWLFESENKILRGVEKKVAAESLITAFPNTGIGGALTHYNQILGTLGEAQLYYKEASSYLKEVIRETTIAEE